MNIVRTDRYQLVVCGGGPAALALQTGATVQNVDVQQLRAQLWRDGLLDPDTIPFP